MAQQLDSMGNGFFHPYARSVSFQPPVPTQPATIAPDKAQAPAAGGEAMPTSGGFVNPHARAPKQ